MQKESVMKRVPEDMVYTVEEVAVIMRTSKQYVYSLVNAHQLRVLKIPHTRIRMDGVQYTVSQVQEKYDSIPPAMYVTLNKAMPEYSMAERIDDEGD